MIAGERRSLSARVGLPAAVVAAILILGGVAVMLLRKATATQAVSQVSTAAQAPVAVKVALPDRRQIPRQVSLPATLDAFEQVTLYAKTSGYLKWINVDLGDRVRKGQVVAEIDVPEIVPEYRGSEAEVERARANIGNQRAELERAKADLDLKKLTYDRVKSIRDQEPDVIPQQQVDEAKAQYEVARATVTVAENKIKIAESEASKAEAARGRLNTLMGFSRIVAPLDGVVTKRHADPGALIQQASSQTNVSPVVTVARIDLMRVFIDVTELDVPFVKKGNRAVITVDALPGKTFEGTTTRFATALDPKTRTMRTEIDIPNRGSELRPGMYGKVTVTLEVRENALTVPAKALVIEGAKTYVFTAADGKAKRVEVKTGLDDGINVEITDGLTGGERVIVSDRTSIKDGMPVEAS
jgi:RND family efflux transporter MFP subunit